MDLFESPDWLKNRPRMVHPTYLVNSRGQKLIVSSIAIRRKLLSQGWSPWFIDIVNNEAPLFDTVLVHRCKGGLGDMITIRPGIEALSRTSVRAIDLAIPKIYFWIFKDIIKLRLIDYDELFPVDGDYNEVRNRYRLAIDLFCPAGVHETLNAHRPTIGRIRIFSGSLYGDPVRPKLESIFPKDVAVKKKKIVAFQISSERIEKDWPLLNYVELSKRLSSENIRCVSIHPTKRLPGVMSITGKTQQEVAYFFQRYVDLVVGPDSGLLHLASALDKPTLWLFGPTDPVTTLEFYTKSEFIHKKREDTCFRPCYYNVQYNKFRCQGRCGDCMSEISVDEVAEKIVDMLRS